MGMSDSRNGRRLSRGAKRLVPPLVTFGAALVLLTGLGSVAGASSSEVAQAKAFVAQHTALVKNIPITGELPARPKSGATLDVMIDTTPSATQVADGVKAAAAHLGWKVDVINAGSTPESQAAAMSVIVENHPTAVIGSGFPTATFPTQIATLRKDGIPFVTNGSTDCTTTCNYDKVGVVADVNSTPSNTEVGQWLAEWITADSNGKANSVVWDLSSYNVLNVVANSYVARLKQICPGCSSDLQDVTTASIGTTLPSQIVSYLQSHPSVNYMAMTYGALTTGLQAALQSAGLSNRVKIADDTGSVANLQAIASGTSPEKVFVPYSETIVGWMETDAVARYLQHATVNEAEYASAPRNFLVQSNIKTPLADNNSVPNYQAQFLKLWKVGS